MTFVVLVAVMAILSLVFKPASAALATWLDESNEPDDWQM